MLQRAKIPWGWALPQEEQAWQKRSLQLTVSRFLGTIWPTNTSISHWIQCLYSSAGHISEFRPRVQQQHCRGLVKKKRSPKHLIWKANVWICSYFPFTEHTRVPPSNTVIEVIFYHVVLFGIQFMWRATQILLPLCWCLAALRYSRELRMELGMKSRLQLTSWLWLICYKIQTWIKNWCLQKQQKPDRRETATYKFNDSCAETSLHPQLTVCTIPMHFLIALGCSSFLKPRKQQEPA